MKAKTYKLTLFEVQTIGGQIIDYQTPKKVTVICDSIEQKNEIKAKARRYELWNSDNRYYATMKQAEDSINWALSN